MKIKTDKYGFAEQDGAGRITLTGEGEKIKVKNPIPVDSPVVLSNFSIEIVREEKEKKEDG
jgi:hypothetical protein